MSIKFELTQYQYHQINALGHALWPNRNLPRDEICRRVLLDAADRLRVRSDGERLLEEVCQPR